MPRFSRYRPLYNGELLAKDMMLRGWNPEVLGPIAGTTGETIRRFIKGKHQTPRIASRLAHALGYPVERYFLRLEAVCKED